MQTMQYKLVELQYAHDFATITMNNPKKRNALSLKHMQELTAAFREVGESRVRGVILAANGPAFSAGHDFADMAGNDLEAMRKILRVCTTLMDTIQQIPQPVLARVMPLPQQQVASWSQPAILPWLRRRPVLPRPAARAAGSVLPLWWRSVAI